MCKSIEEMIYKSNMNDDQVNVELGHITLDMNALSGKNESISDSVNEKESIDQETKCSLIKRFLLQRAQDTTLHGFPRILAPANTVFLFVKILWVIFTLACWAYFIYQIHNVIKRYAAFEVDTDVSVGHETPTLFPAVDICNINAYNGKKIGNLIEGIIAFKELKVNESSSFREYTSLANDQFKASYELKASQENFSTYLDGFKLKEMLVSCEYGGKPCTYKDFYWYHDYKYGNCYRFNGADPNQTKDDHEYISHPIRNTIKPGWQGGLRLELYAGDQDTEHIYTYATGFRVTIHNQSTVPFMNDEGIDIAPGLQTTLGVSRTFINRMPEPYSNCIGELDEKLAQRNSLFARMYKQKEAKLLSVYQQAYCLKQCEQDYYARVCNCTSFNLKFQLKYDNETASSEKVGCSTRSEIECLQKAEERFYESDEIKNCFDLCPIECDQVLYFYDFSTSSYPSKWYAQKLNEYQNFFNYYYIFDNNKPDYNGPTQEILKSTTVMLNVHYDSITYTYIKESASLTMEALLSDLGGNFGLFAGASVLSLAEIFEIIFTIIFICFNAKIKVE